MTWGVSPRFTAPDLMLLRSSHVLGSDEGMCRQHTSSSGEFLTRRSLAVHLRCSPRNTGVTLVTSAGHMCSALHNAP